MNTLRWYAGCEIRLIELITRLDPFQYATEDR